MVIQSESEIPNTQPDVCITVYVLPMFVIIDVCLYNVCVQEYDVWSHIYDISYFSTEKGKLQATYREFNFPYKFTLSLSPLNELYGKAGALNISYTLGDVLMIYNMHVFRLRWCVMCNNGCSPLLPF